MKYCECRSFNMCVLNPDAKDDDPETSGCFKSSSDNGDINQTVPKSMGRRWRIIGGVLLWIGIAGIIVSFIVFFHDTGSGLIEDYMEPIFYGTFGFLVSLFIAFSGAMIWFAGRREEKRCLNSGDEHDSELDANKTLKKSRLQKRS